jgi:hypothetical protein
VSKEIQDELNVWMGCLGQAYASDEMQALNKKRGVERGTKTFGN